METIAFFNLKGGVGKTTSAVNIAWHAANEGIPTLVWDLDPQGASSWLFNTTAKSETKPKKLLTGKTPIGDLVRSTEFENLDIIPADFSFRHLDHQLSEQSDQGKQNLIAKLVEPFSENYALMILDCPPSFSLLTEQIFATADSLFLPLIPTHLSLRTFEQTRDFFKEHKLKPKRLHAFFNMVDRRRSMHRVMLAHPPKMLKNGLKTAIPYAAIVERMGDYRQPLPAFDKQSTVSQAYAELWREIKQTLSDF
ncbi:MAG: AAA family ATPase [Pseudomonadota bacterium]|uniref:ParA family protein n=1 Tax=Methylophaga TaxID=40222 RepID=UPI0024E1BD45|nr:MULTISPECIES: AAA family ATPase [Methylophaga]MEC9413544.1 AAA family ATPase [Pseudomonadota bacterium]WVI84204.1 AAA family ATPase [Methylophaga thalassica]